MEKLIYRSSERMTLPLIDSGLRDSDYVESLNWAKNIRVVNYLPYIKYPEVLQSPTTFLSRYEARQELLLNQIAQIAEYIKEQDLQTLRDVKKEHLATLRGFIANADRFFAQTTYFGLNAKRIEDDLFLLLKERYPHLDSRLLLTPSQPASPILKIFKASDYLGGQNDDFVGMFCAGNRNLALKVAKGLLVSNDADIRDTVRQCSIEKGYFMQGKNDIKLLDRILVIDNTIENLIWKDSWMTAPLYHVYNLAQEIVCPSPMFMKEKYVFDIKMITENF